MVMRAKTRTIDAGDRVPQTKRRKKKVPPELADERRQHIAQGADTVGSAHQQRRRLDIEAPLLHEVSGKKECGAAVRGHVQELAEEENDGGLDEVGSEEVADLRRLPYPMVPGGRLRSTLSGLVMAAEALGLSEITPDDEDEGNAQQSDEKHRAPAPSAQNGRCHQRGQKPADRIAGLQNPGQHSAEPGR
jgi:hypothetical protein